MARENYCFLSAFEEGFDYNEVKVIALTPEVCARLSRAQIPYEVLDETCVERDLEKDARRYFFEQLDWFKAFDEFIKENIEYCRLNDLSLATAHYNQLKYVIDSAISYAYVLNMFVQKHRPGKIIHLASAAEEKVDPSIYSLFHSPTTTVAQLLPHVCANQKVPFERRIVKDELQKQPASTLGAFKSTVKDMLLAMGVKSFLNFVRFQKPRCFMPGGKSLRSSRMLFLHAGCFSVDEAIRQSLFAGARVFTMGKNSIDQELAIWQRRAVVLDNGREGAFAARIKEQCRIASQVLRGNHSLFSWLSQKSGIDISGFILPSLNHFISDICYDTILKTEKLLAFYDRYHIDMVLMRASTGYDSAFVLAAAKMRRSIKRVCIQHSCTALDGLLLPMTELGFFDYYLATDGISEDYFNAYRKYDIFCDCQVRQAAHYLSWIQKRYRQKSSKRGRERIIFAPSDARVGIGNLNNQFYQDGIWYLAFLRELLEYFAKRQDKIFVFKYRFGQHFMRKVMIPYIISQGYSNIILESRPLADCFRLGQRVILDYPSSGLFEAAAAGLPVMSLYKRSFITWPDAVKFFGCSLQPFSDAAEAKEAIERFLGDDPAKYMRRLPLSSDTFVKVLTGVASAEAN